MPWVFLLFLVYVLGGLTFLPLCLAALLALLLYLSPPAPPSSLPPPQTDNPVEDDLPQLFRSGWLIVRRTYEPIPVNDTSYIGFLSSGYRSIMDTRSRPQSRPKDSFFAVLKKQVLYLYDNEEQRECWAAIELATLAVTMYPNADIDGQLFVKRNAIALYTPDASSPIPVPPAVGVTDCLDPSELLPWFFFPPTNSEKEDWYHALLSASTVSLPTPPSASPESLFDSSDMSRLILSIDAQPDPIPVRWLNAFLGRIFLGIYHTQAFKDYLIGRMMNKLQRVKKPQFLSDVRVRDVDVGSVSPFFSRPMLKDLSPKGDASVELDVSYAQGDLRITVEAVVSINLGSRFKSYRVPIMLAVVLKKLQGTLLVKLKRPPSNRIWFGFTSMPDMQLAVEPVVSTRQIKWSMILNAIESQLRQIILESIVLPHLDDIVFFDSSPYSKRGGIWADSLRHQENPVSDIIKGDQNNSESVAGDDDKASVMTAESTTQVDTSSSASSLRRRNKSSNTKENNNSNSSTDDVSIATHNTVSESNIPVPENTTSNDADSSENTKDAQENESSAMSTATPSSRRSWMYPRRKSSTDVSPLKHKPSNSQQLPPSSTQSDTSSLSIVEEQENGEHADRDVNNKTTKSQKTSIADDDDQSKSGDRISPTTPETGATAIAKVKEALVKAKADVEQNSSNNNSNSSSATVETFTKADSSSNGATPPQLPPRKAKSQPSENTPEANLPSASQLSSLLAANLSEKEPQTANFDVDLPRDVKVEASTAAESPLAEPFSTPPQLPPRKNNHKSQENSPRQTPPLSSQQQQQQQASLNTTTVSNMIGTLRNKAADKQAITAGVNQARATMKRWGANWNTFRRENATTTTTSAASAVSQENHSSSTNTAVYSSYSSSSFNHSGENVAKNNNSSNTSVNSITDDKNEMDFRRHRRDSSHSAGKKAHLSHHSTSHSTSAAAAYHNVQIDQPQQSSLSNSPNANTYNTRTEKSKKRESSRSVSSSRSSFVDTMNNHSMPSSIPSSTADSDTFGSGSVFVELPAPPPTAAHHQPQENLRRRSKTSSVITEKNNSNHRHGLHPPPNLPVSSITSFKHAPGSVSAAESMVMTSSVSNPSSSPPAAHSPGGSWRGSFIFAKDDEHSINNNNNNSNSGIFSPGKSMSSSSSLETPSDYPRVSLSESPKLMGNVTLASMPSPPLPSQSQLPSAPSLPPRTPENQKKRSASATADKRDSTMYSSASSSHSAAYIYKAQPRMEIPPLLEPSKKISISSNNVAEQMASLNKNKESPSSSSPSMTPPPPSVPSNLPPPPPLPARPEHSKIAINHTTEELSGSNTNVQQELLSSSSTATNPVLSNINSHSSNDNIISQ